VQAVARDALNIFLPFRRLEPNHENQLTRALLVVLRLSPIAHTAWLRLIAPDRRIEQLPPASFDTQVRAVRHASADDDPAELVSVFLTPEEPLPGDRVVTESDRGQVLDAVIDYGGELLVVVENKVADDNDLQARHLNVTGAKVRIAPGQEAVVVLWRDVLEALHRLRERDLLGGAEAAMLDDFLTYVENNFPLLGPFRTLRLARGSRSRQHRRLRKVLVDATGTEALLSTHGPYATTAAGETIGANAYLAVPDDEGRVELSLYPADTLSQARALYSCPAEVERLLALADEPDWEISPNFHFGHFQRGYCWTTTTRGTREYVELWRQRIDEEGEIPRKRWDDYWRWLEAERIATPDDRDEFDLHFTQTQRQKASPRPGLRLARAWPLADAETLDSRNALADAVRAALDQALTASGEPLLARSSEADAHASTPGP
jgi:hypothetical protein